MRILILSASYGSGHAEAARSLAAAFASARGRAVVVDHFRELVHPVFAQVEPARLLLALRHAPWLWALGYAWGTAWGPSPPLAFGMTRARHRAPRPACSTRCGRTR